MPFALGASQLQSSVQIPGNSAFLRGVGAQVATSVPKQSLAYASSYYSADPMMVTWNPADTSTQITFSNANLSVNLPVVQFGSVRATVARIPDDYFEVVFSTVLTGGGAASSVGLANISAIIQNDYLSHSAASIAYNCNGLVAFNNVNLTITAPVYAAGDIIGCEIKTSSVDFFKNGTLAYSAASFPTGPLYAAVTLGNQNDACTGNFGATPFRRALPVGVSSWDESQPNPSSITFNFPPVRKYLRR